ncbi:hypothetical protein AAFF_G00185090 [Aldrovandia affinis]|uniref:Uncharacterized protein n=1 Tax=Aldrovandia affinis TaxID=143900 RepID=A0AAD7RK41_9TELE|nr:hypothetical protein AAFF_G00185090 [Aldrovandia affinis]
MPAAMADKPEHSVPFELPAKATEIDLENRPGWFCVRGLTALMAGISREHQRPPQVQASMAAHTRAFAS